MIILSSHVFNGHDQLGRGRGRGQGERIGSDLISTEAIPDRGVGLVGVLNQLSELQLCHQMGRIEDFADCASGDWFDDRYAGTSSLEPNSIQDKADMLTPVRLKTEHTTESPLSGSAKEEYIPGRRETP